MVDSAANARSAAAVASVSMADGAASARSAAGLSLLSTRSQFLTTVVVLTKQLSALQLWPHLFMKESVNDDAVGGYAGNI